jgi:predicted nucleic acid-binding protein
MYRDDPSLIAWWVSRVECDSAIARLTRERRLSPVAARSATRRLDLLAASWQEVQPGDALRDQARRLLRLHDLRAGDALQLAAALAASEQRPASLEFVCLDSRLVGAAEREGFSLAGA